jgi:hypothetical protein
MEQYEFNTHTFVAKIWLEEMADEAGRASWRGHITHVPSGERRYFEELQVMSDFVSRYLEQMDVKIHHNRNKKRPGRWRYLGRCQQ